MRIKSIGVLSITIYLSAILAFSQTLPHGSSPQRIIVNSAAQSANSMAITWQTIEELQNSGICNAEAAGWKDFRKSAVMIKAKIEAQKLAESQVVYHYSGLLNESSQIRFMSAL